MLLQNLLQLSSGNNRIAELKQLTRNNVENFNSEGQRQRTTTSNKSTDYYAKRRQTLRQLRKGNLGQDTELHTL